MLRGREAAGPKLRAASHLLLLLGVGGERHRVSRLERDLGLFLGHLGAPQRPRMLELIHSRRVASPSSDPLSQPPFAAHPDTSTDRQRR